MTNEDIVEQLDLTAKLLELHDGDPFKVRSYAAAAYNLDKYNERLFSGMTVAELSQLKGVGKSLAGKIEEIARTGTFPELSDLLTQTPEGVLEMFKIKGIGVKKIHTVWHELGIESVYELEQACENGTIAKLKGFGGSTQQKILESIAFLKSQKGKLRMDKAVYHANTLREALLQHFEQVEIAGEVRRQTEIVHQLVLLVATTSPIALQNRLDSLDFLLKDVPASSPFVWRGHAAGSGVAVEIVAVSPERIPNELFISSAAPDHLSRYTATGKTLYQLARHEVFDTAESLYTTAGLPYIVPEMREGQQEWQWAEKHTPEELITWEALKGILHNHSTYSDGRNTLEQMAQHCRELGFEYLGIADHSQSAAYANGLRPERVLEQHAEIDRLNRHYAAAFPERPFRILKGIESDILGDGSLDYPDEVLATFDFVVASVHSNLTMSLEKAMDRLLRAIANPYTTMLGHPTGRLLLSRVGYPVDHKILIDACVEHQVVIEINASPWRLDIDWRWIDYCMERGALLSINPDAHETAGYLDMHYGVAVARKGGLTTAHTFNALPLQEIEEWLQQRKRRLFTHTS